MEPQFEYIVERSCSKMDKFQPRGDQLLAALGLLVQEHNHDTVARERRKAPKS